MKSLGGRGMQAGIAGVDSGMSFEWVFSHLSAAAAWMCDVFCPSPLPYRVVKYLRTCHAHPP